MSFQVILRSLSFKVFIDVNDLDVKLPKNDLKWPKKMTLNDQKNDLKWLKKMTLNDLKKWP